MTMVFRAEPTVLAQFKAGDLLRFKADRVESSLKVRTRRSLKPLAAPSTLQPTLPRVNRGCLESNLLRRDSDFVKDSRRFRFPQG